MRRLLIISLVIAPLSAQGQSRPPAPPADMLAVMHRIEPL